MLLHAVPAGLPCIIDSHPAHRHEQHGGVILDETVDRLKHALEALQEAGSLVKRLGEPFGCGCGAGCARNIQWKLPKAESLLVETHISWVGTTSRDM